VPRGVSRAAPIRSASALVRGVSVRAEDASRAEDVSRASRPRARRSERAQPQRPPNLRPMPSCSSKKNHRSIGAGRTFVADVLQQSLRRGVRRGVLHHEQNLFRGRGGYGEIKTSDGQLQVLRRPRTRVGNETIARTRFVSPRTEMQHRACLPVGVALRVAAATEGNPLWAPSTYPEPFREPRPRGMDQILRALARGELGGRHRVARRCTREGRYNHTTPTCQPRRAPDTACASTRDRVLNGELLPSKPLRTCASTRPTRARHEWRGGARVGR